MKRKGDVHLFRGLHYLLDLACGFHPHAASLSMHFSTKPEHVTCKKCLRYLKETTK